MHMVPRQPMLAAARCQKHSIDSVYTWTSIVGDNTADFDNTVHAKHKEF